MSNVYQDLIESDLYPESFVDSFGKASTFWFRETWRNREASLRHDMVCVLFCNMEPNVNLKRKILSQLSYHSKRLKLDFGDTQSIPSTSTVFADPEETDEDEEFRFILLEGNDMAPQLQNKYADKWGIEHPDKLWDLIDLKEKRFIEVKVTKNPLQEVNDFDKWRIGKPDYYSLFVADPENMSITFHLHSGELRGEVKVKTFLAKRKLKLEQWGQTMPEADDPEVLISRMFCNDWFNSSVSEWTRKIWDLRNLQEPPNYTTDDGERLRKITCSQLIEGLEDPRKRDLPETKWEGKILAENMCDNFVTSESSDKEIVKLFFETIGDTNEEKIEVVRSLLIQKDWDNFNIFAVGDKLEEGVSLLLESLGVGMKRRVYNEDDRTTKMEETKAMEKKKPAVWFDNTLRELVLPHGLEGMPARQLLKAEFTSDHPMAYVSQECINSFMKMYLGSTISVMVSKNIHFYTRLGRNYSPGMSEGDKYRNKIVCFPIISTIYKGDEKYRLCSGICIRSPVHARMPTDKINFITLELLNQNDNYYWDKIKNGKVIMTRKGITLCMRQNAISRMDPTFEMFLHDATLVAANFLGEVVFNNPNIKADEDIRSDYIGIVKDFPQWLLGRIVEGVMTALLGRSQEEGYMAQLRKIYMVLMAISREGKRFNWDIGTLCEKTNECMISSPICMHYQISLLSILNSWVEDTGFTEASLAFNSLLI